MSEDDYSRVETAKLIEMFVDLAKSTATVYAEWPQALEAGPSEKVRASPERDAKIAKMRPIAAAIAARKPVADVRRLFEDGDLNVRAWTTAMLKAVDPEWAKASLSGLFAGLTATAVLALQALARQPPPFGPPIETLSDDELVARFEELGEREDATQFLDCVGDPKDMDIRNEIVGQALDAMRALKARGLLPRLLPLLDNEKIAVRYEAALACLRIAPEKSIAVLEAIVASRDPDFLGQAHSALTRWRQNGRAVWGM